MNSESTAVVVSGFFGPLHVGHLDMIEQAADLGDRLIVIVNNDAQQVLKKGKVIIAAADRLRIVKALRDVDEAVLAIDQDSAVSATLALLARQSAGYRLIFANGGDRVSSEVVPETAICNELGIAMMFGIGGDEKADSSSRINIALGLQEPDSLAPGAGG